MTDQIIQSVVEWVQSVPPISIYLLFITVAYLENVIPPMPGDVLVAFSGYLAAEGLVQLFPVYVITTIASVFGFMTMYWLGGRWSFEIAEERKDHWVLKFFDYSYFDSGKKWMDKWGQGVILANRFLAGTRSIISLTAGFYKINPRWTVLSSLISSMLWNALLIGFGWFVKSNWQSIKYYLTAYSKIILIGITILVLLRFFFWYRRRQKHEKINPENPE